MKFTATKKTIVILILSFLVLVLGIISFIYRDFISNGINTGRWFTLDKYEELLEDCEYVKSGKEIKVVCKGLLERIGSPDTERKTRCPYLRILTKDNNLKNFDLCVTSDKLDFTNPYDIYDLYIPVQITLVYKNSKSLDYNFDSISMKMLLDSEINRLAQTNKAFTSLLGKALNNTTGSLKKYGYYIFEDDVEENLPLKQIYFQDLLLEEVAPKGDFVEFLFSGMIHGKKKRIRIVSQKSFYFVFNSDVSSDTFITLDNYTSLKKGVKYQVYFFGLSSNDKSEIERINQRCKEDVSESAVYSFCSKNMEMTSDYYIPDVNTHLRELFESSSEEITLDRLILVDIARFQ
jgi:hypothetical protein